MQITIDQFIHELSTRAVDIHGVDMRIHPSQAYTKDTLSLTLTPRNNKYSEHIIRITLHETDDKNEPLGFFLQPNTALSRNQQLVLLEAIMTEARRDETFKNLREGIFGGYMSDLIKEAAHNTDIALR